MSKNVTEEALLEGSWLALEQAGALIRDSVALYEAGSYSTAIVVALLGREELGRSRILRNCSTDVSAGMSLSASQVQKRCSDHEEKQSASAFSILLTPPRDSVLGRALLKQSVSVPWTDEWKEANRTIETASSAKAQRQASDRHSNRCDALYVDISDSGTEWNRPLDLTKDEAYRHVSDVANDYAMEHDRLINTGLHDVLSERSPQVRAAEMAEANARRLRPILLPAPSHPGISDGVVTVKPRLSRIVSGCRTWFRKIFRRCRGFLADLVRS